MGKFVEQLKIYLKVLFLNRRSTILSFLGLGLSLVLITEGLVFTYSFQYNAFNDYVGTPPPRQVSAFISPFILSGDVSEVYDDFYNVSNQAISTLSLENRIKKIDWYFEKAHGIGVRSEDGSEQIIREFNLFGIAYDYFSTLESFLFNGSMPNGKDDVIVVHNNNILEKSNLSNTGIFQLYIPTFGGYSHYGPVNVSGTMKKELIEKYEGALQDDFKAMLNYFTDGFMIINADNFPKPRARDFPQNNVKATGRIAFYLENVNAFSINQEISVTNSLSQELTRILYTEGYYVHVYNTLSTILRNFANEYQLFQIFGLLFLSPLVVITVALTSFSANQLKRRQKHHLALLNQRGSSKFSNWLLLLIQLFEVTISGIILGIAIGYPFSWLILKSSGVLLFTNISVLPVINLAIFFGIIISAFIISFFVNLRDIKEFTNISLFAAHKETQEHKTFWKRIYLDFILIIFGLAIWLVIKYPLQETEAYLFSYIIGIISPAMILLGGVLLLSRIYLWILKALSNIIWKNEKLGILWFSLKRSNRREKSTIKSIILIALTISLTFTALISVKSYQKYNDERAYYSLGADILIRNVNTYSEDTINQLLTIEGVESASYIFYTSQIVTLGEATYSYSIVGIDPLEFANTAYFDNEYLGKQNPSDFFSNIKNSTNIIMQRNQLEKVAASNASTIFLPAEKYIEGSVFLELQIVGLYNFLPRYFNEYPDLESTVYRFTIIGNYDLVRESAYSSFNVQHDIIVKTSKDHRISNVIDDIDPEISGLIYDIETESEIYNNEFKNTMLYGSINTTLIALFIIIIISIFLLIAAQLIENKQEIRIIRLLGFSPKQFFSLFLSDTVFMIINTIAISFILSIISSFVIMDVLTFKINIPLYEISVPVFQILIVCFSLFVITILTTIGSILVIFRSVKKIAVKEIVTE